MNNKNIPNLFIIGAPKCGTTSLIHYLKQHPDIFVSIIKEPHYFNLDSDHRYYFREEDYLNLFSEANNSYKYYAEGSVWYFYSLVAVDEIIKFNPNAKFIVMLRNPVSMFFSLHQELLFGGSEDEKSALKSWKLQEQRKNGKDIPLGCSDPRFIQYGEVCKLGKQAVKVSQKVSNSNVLFILLDDLITQPDFTYNKILRFLELAPLSLKSYEIVNRKKVRKSYVLSKFFIYTTKLKKKLGITKGIGIANALNKLNVSHNISIDQDAVELLSPVLIDYFYEDITLLETVINKDLSVWKKAKIKPDI